MKKTVRELVEAIVADGCSVYGNDDGNGCGGPFSYSSSDLQEMLDEDELDGYEVLDSDGETWDGRSTVKEVIADTLDMMRHDKNDGTQWLLAERVDFDGSENPYRHYLLLWEVKA